MKGWFEIPGVQSGDRTLAEQLLGLEPALAACAGKTVLDLGCAEGLIAREFLARGARGVIGLDNNAPFVAVAREAGMERARFFECNLNDPGEGFRDRFGADIVLALAIVHKLRLPGRSLAEFAAMARERLVIRLAAGSTGVIRHKYGESQCDSREVMPACGFALEQVLEGPRGELVQHWVR